MSKTNPTDHPTKRPPQPRNGDCATRRANRIDETNPSSSIASLSPARPPPPPCLRPFGPLPQRTPAFPNAALRGDTMNGARTPESRPPESTRADWPHRSPNQVAKIPVRGSIGRSVKRGHATARGPTARLFLGISNMLITWRGIIGIGLGLLAGRTVLADAVFTSDGSKIVGTIERMGGDKIVIVSEVAGRLEIDTTKITAVAIDNQLNVEFKSGDRLVGTLDVSADQSTSVMHSALGELAVKPTDIAAIWPVGSSGPAELAMQAEVELAKKAFIPEWNFTLEAGGSSTEGNTETLEARGRLDVTRKTDNDLLNFYLAAKYYDQNDIRSTNEYRGGIRYENAITDRWYWYTRVELEFDEFENLDLRSTAAVGGGYYWLKKSDHELKTGVGIGYRHESYNNGVSDDQAVLDLMLNYRLDLAPWLQFTHATTYSPDFLELDDYRLDFDTALLMPFTDDRFKLKFGVNHEYNSRPQPGLERLDTTYYANLVFQLKNFTQ